MSTKHKYDFAVILSVKNANPNGDPLNGNRPRTNYDDIGEISDVCLKRKIRNRLMTMEQPESILVQSNDNTNDEHQSIKARIDACKDFDLKDPKKFKKQACAKWFDVRAFGQIFPFKGTKSGEGVSIPVRGPVTIHSAYSLEPVSISSIQITKSTNLEDSKAGKKGSDTMGMKHRVDFGIYTFFGSINQTFCFVDVFVKIRADFCYYVSWESFSNKTVSDFDLFIKCFHHNRIIVFL